MIRLAALNIIGKLLFNEKNHHGAVRIAVLLCENGLSSRTRKSLNCDSVARRLSRNTSYLVECGESKPLSASSINIARSSTRRNESTPPAIIDIHARPMKIHSCRLFLPTVRNMKNVSVCIDTRSVPFADQRQL